MISKTPARRHGKAARRHGKAARQRRQGGTGANYSTVACCGIRQAPPSSLLKHHMMDANINNFCKIPDHLLVEIFVLVPNSEWFQISCVSKRWASVFRAECLWKAAIARAWPSAIFKKRWPGPIFRGLAKRRYMALYVSEHVISLVGEVDELVGHAYLFLKEQLELSATPPPSSILHGTIIDQFIACGRTRDNAHELASQIWITVINNLEENVHTFELLKRLALEGNYFLPYPYSRSEKVLWTVFEKLFTDFRDCFTRVDFYDLLSFAEARFLPIPSTWLGR